MFKVAFASIQNRFNTSHFNHLNTYTPTHLNTYIPTYLHTYWFHHSNKGFGSRNAGFRAPKFFHDLVAT